MAKVIGPITADTSGVTDHCNLLKIYGILTADPATNGIISVSNGDTAGSGDVIYTLTGGPQPGAEVFDIEFPGTGLSFGRTGFSVDITNTVQVWFVVN